MKCPGCFTLVKNWQGSDPNCGFKSGVFSPDNWNCALINRVRDLVYEGNPTPIPGVDYQYCSDQKYATVNIDNIVVQSETVEEPHPIGLALWVSWYKSRGSTDAMWILSDDSPPREPSIAEVEAILKYYNK